VQSLTELIDVTFLALCRNEVLPSMLVEDVLVLGTDPDEWWDGLPALTQAMKAQYAQLEQASAEHEGDRRVREHGDVAWFAEHVVVGFGDSTYRMRMSGVAVRQDGEWRFAQLQAAPAIDALPLPQGYARARRRRHPPHDFTSSPSRLTPPTCLPAPRDGRPGG